MITRSRGVSRPQHGASARLAMVMYSLDIAEPADGQILPAKAKHATAKSCHG